MTISSAVLDAIRAHAAAEPDAEVCGLLFGTPEAVSGVQRAANVADDRTRRFEIDPAALFAALRAERAGGARVVGYYHSHPNGGLEPSATDQAMAAKDSKCWIIVSGESVSAWRAETTFIPINLLLSDSDDYEHVKVVRNTSS